MRVSFAEEVRAAEKELFCFELHVVCTVTGSTPCRHAGGFADGARMLIGIDASFTPVQTKAQVA